MGGGGGYIDLSKDFLFFRWMSDRISLEIMYLRVFMTVCAWVYVGAHVYEACS